MSSPDSRPVTTGIGGPRPLPALPQAKNASISVETLAPHIYKYAAKYGVNPQIVAAVVAQESSFVNHRVHRDGTGHGLIGLDDNGLLPDFERWSGTRVGRGKRANTIPPEKQIEFLAKKLADFSEKHGGDVWEAVREWHGGYGGRDRRHAHHYEDLIRGRIPEIAHAVRPVAPSGAEPPGQTRLASAGQPSTFAVAEGPQRVALSDGRPATPVPGSIDYETT